MGSASSREKARRARDGCLKSKLRTATVVAGADAGDKECASVHGVLGRWSGMIGDEWGRRFGV